MKRTDLKGDANTPEGYDEIYFGPRTNQVFAHKWRMDMIKELNINKGNILDVGCGIGRYFPAFGDNQIYGTELSLKAIAEAKRLYPNAYISQWFAGTPLPFYDNFFNFVWCGEFLEHIQDPQQAIDEIYRVLISGGIALFMTPIGQNSKCPEHLWFFDDKDIEGFFSKYPNKEITHTFDEASPLKVPTQFKIVLKK